MTEILLISSDGEVVCQPYIVNKVEPRKVGLSGFCDAEQRNADSVPQHAGEQSQVS